MAKKRGRKNSLRILPVIAGVFVCVVAVVGILIYIRKYAPTREQMPLTEYYTYFGEDDAALIVDDSYEAPAEGQEAGDAILTDGRLYLRREALKSRLDDRYVFDDEEEVMRYATDISLISVPYGGAAYSVDKEAATYDQTIVQRIGEEVYVSADFAREYTDFSYVVYEEPNRAVIYTAGYTRDVAKLRRSEGIRRLGGPKSKILKKGEKGESIAILKDYGKWSEVATVDGVIGYVRSSRLRDREEETEEATLPVREYQHRTMSEPVCMAWHQVTSQAANTSVSRVLGNTKGLNVISPTWFYLNDNSGGIVDLSGKDYVQTAHAAGAQVWGLVSNLENSEVDTTTVLDHTSSRDALVGNLIGAAIAVGLDGINVDFESLAEEAADGYIEFIRELSLRCEKNDLYLSVDNYVPSSYTAFYNRTEQANYADYVVIMGYDEHHRTDTIAGSTASLPFVTAGIEATLEEVPAEQVILGMPFYSRIWMESKDGTLSNETILMKDIDGWLERHKLEATWDEVLGQNYAEYTENETKHMLWIEDAKSLGEKLSAMKDHALAGGSFWKLDCEDSAIWDVIGAYMD